MLTQSELEHLLALGNESQSFEVKGPGDLTDKAYVARVARAALAMANNRDGGTVCLGIADKQLRQMTPGLTPAQLASWSNLDNVHDALARHADPPISLELDTFTLPSRSNVVVLQVAEFDDTPHVCKRPYQDILQEGATYVRPLGKARSVPPPTVTDMRNLLELAVDKGVRNFVRRSREAGLPLGDVLSRDQADKAAYDREARTAWASSSPVVTELMACGHTDIAIRPVPYDETRLPPLDLERTVTRNAVRLRGWPVPFVDQRTPIERHRTWIAQDIKPGVVDALEAWRMCASGQFLHRRALVTDLADGAHLKPNAPGATGAVALWDILLYMVEVAELGARLAATLQLDSVTFQVALRGIAGRQLIAGRAGRPLYGSNIQADDEIAASSTLDPATLLAGPRHVGVDLAQRLIRPFGHDVPDHALLDQVSEVLDRA